MDRVLTIARHFLVDALRASVTRIYLLLLAMAVIAGGFVAQLAVIEQDVFRLSLVSAVIRLLAVAVVTVQGCASFSDQARHGQLELTLSLNMSRGHYLVGRALGGGFYALLLALLATLALA